MQSEILKDKERHICFVYIHKIECSKALIRVSEPFNFDVAPALAPAPAPATAPT